MTRIISGSAGGRRLATPRGDGTRPTTDRAREALFSRLAAMTEIDEAWALDLYAGSGAFGLELASRGATRVLCVESNRVASQVIQRNARDLELPMVKVAAEKVLRVLERGPAEGGFDHPERPGADIILADPPYPLSEAEVADVIAAIAAGGWLAPDGVFVLERSTRSPAPQWPEGWAAVASPAYGETTLHFAQRESDGEVAP